MSAVLFGGVLGSLVGPGALAQAGGEKCLVENGCEFRKQMTHKS